MLYILSSIGHTVRIEIRECVKWSLRDCSLFMPKGGVGDFQAIQAYEIFTPPRKWVF